MADVVFRQRPVVQRQIVAQGAGAVAPRTLPRAGRGAARVGLQAPQVQADVGDIGATATGVDASHVDAAVGAFEGAAEPFQRLALAHIRRLQCLRPQVVHVLGGAQALEVFHRLGVPAGDVAGQLFEHQGGTLASAQCDGMGDLGARAGDLGRHLMQALVADQVADIGHYPVGAGFDEKIVP